MATPVPTSKTVIYFSLWLLQGWSVGESWKHCIGFLGKRGDHLFTYRVQWSEPTRRRPVPKATASVYFYILVQEQVTLSHHIVPLPYLLCKLFLLQNSPVLVFYVLEGQKLVHRWEQT